MIENHLLKAHRRQRLGLICLLAGWPVLVGIGLVMNHAFDDTGYPSVLCVAWLLLIAVHITHGYGMTRRRQVAR